MIPIRGLRAPVRPAPPLPEHRPRWFWPSDKERRLALLWNSGVPIKEIAEALGVSRNAVSGKACRLGLPRRENPVQPCE